MRCLLVSLLSGDFGFLWFTFFTDGEVSVYFMEVQNLCDCPCTDGL